MGSRFDKDNFSPNDALDVTNQISAFLPTLDGEKMECTSWRKIEVFSVVLHEYLCCFICLKVLFIFASKVIE